MQVMSGKVEGISRWSVALIACLAVAGCGLASGAASPTPTPVELGVSRTVGDVTITLNRYSVGPGGYLHVPVAPSGREFLETDWYYRSTVSRQAALGWTTALAESVSFQPQMYGPVLNPISALVHERSGAVWWFEIPSRLRFIQIVYRSPSGAKAVWILTLR